MAGRVLQGGGARVVATQQQEPLELERLNDALQVFDLSIEAKVDRRAVGQTGAAAVVTNQCPAGADTLQLGANLIALPFQLHVAPGQPRHMD